MKPTIVLIALLSLTLIAFELERSLVSEEMVFDELLKAFSLEKAVHMLESRAARGSWPYYIVLTVYTIIRLLVVTLVMTTSLYLFDIKSHFSSAFYSVVSADFVHLFPAVVKFVWFNSIQTTYSFQDLREFPRFSIVDIVNLLWIRDDRLIDSAISQLNSFNVFEVFFCLLLAKQLSTRQGLEFQKVFSATAYAYFFGLALVAIVFAYLSVIIQTR